MSQPPFDPRRSDDTQQFPAPRSFAATPPSYGSPAPGWDPPQPGWDPPQPGWGPPQPGQAPTPPAWGPPQPPMEAPGPKRSWYQKKRVIIPGALIALTVLGSAVSGGTKDDRLAAASSETGSTSVSTAAVEPAPVSTPPAEQAVATTPAPAPVIEPTIAAVPTPEVTPGQRNALGSAQDYLSFMPFSRTGLIGQLEFDDYSTDDATWAVDNLTVDWNEQAALAAQNYLDFMSFSHDGLVDQLEFDHFTPEEAEYGVTAAGL